MTSIPASRKARAMIFAPRSWPSRPGFAITTRSFAATSRQVYERSTFAPPAGGRRGRPSRPWQRRPRSATVKLTVVGSSPAWPNPGSAQSGYLVDGGEGTLLLDCGPGVLARLRELHGGWPTVDAIAITHFHLDHWGDIATWSWGSMFVGRDR